MQLRPAEAELVFNALAPLLGKMSVHSVPELTAALNELAHLRKFRDDLQRENARVAMKNQKLEERLQLVVKLLDENTPKSLEYAALLAKSELV